MEANRLLTKLMAYASREMNKWVADRETVLSGTMGALALWSHLGRTGTIPMGPMMLRAE